MADSKAGKEGETKRVPGQYLRRHGLKQGRIVAELRCGADQVIWMSCALGRETRRCMQFRRQMDDNI